MIADTMTIRIAKLDPSIEQVIGINSNFFTLPFKDELPSNSLRTDGYTGILYEIKM